MDNWTLISENIKTKLSAQCEAFYYSFLFNNKHEEKSISAISLQQERDKRLENNNATYQTKLKEIIERNAQSKNYITTSFVNGYKSGVGPNIKVKEKLKKDYIHYGFHKERFELEFEYLNDFEKNIVEIEFNDSDTKIEIDTKLELLLLYNDIIEERDRRKKYKNKT